MRNSSAAVERCPAAPWWSRRHKFEARYNGTVAEIDWHLAFLMKPEQLQALGVDKMKREYVHDICVRCGKTVRNHD